MSETRKISLLIPSSGKVRNVTELLLKVRIKIKEIKLSQPELKDFSLANVGMYRENGGIRVNLYFSRNEQKAFASVPLTEGDVTK
ncbi:MAG: hypothetical protein ACOX47_05995 [Bacillota bacterium]|jgi:hypothetical protein